MRDFKVVCLLAGGENGIVKGAKTAQYARVEFAKRIRHKYPQLALSQITHACSAYVLNPQHKPTRTRKYNIFRGMQ